MKGNPTFLRQLNRPTELLPHQTIKLWRNNPFIFIKDALDLTLDLWQEEAVHNYHTSPRTALIASKGPGKTFVESICTWHFFLCHTLPKIACLSISKDHLMSNLWAELLKLLSTRPLLKASANEGMSKITLKGHEGYSFIDARAYPKQSDERQQASVLAGLHADNVMFTIDEGGLIPDAIISTADAALSTGDSATKKARLLIAGNPEVPSGLVYRASKGRTLQKWAVQRVSGDPDDPKRAPRVSITWARELIAEYGRDDPWVKVNVLNEYPEVGVEFALTEEQCLISANRKVEEKDVRGIQFRLGIDVAQGGQDHTVFAPRRGALAYPMTPFPSTLTGHELASRTALMCSDMGIEKVYIDNTGGYGSSLVDNLQTYPSIDFAALKYNAKAQRPDRYFNLRSEIIMRMVDWIKTVGKIPNCPRLIKALTSFKIQVKGSVTRVEEKDKIKARLGRSPDEMDSLANTFADVEQPSNKPTLFDEFGRPIRNAYVTRHLSDPKDAMRMDDSHNPHQNHRAW